MDELYRKLQEWLHDISPNGFRRMDSGQDLEFLKMLLTPEEGRLALYLTLDLKPLAAIAECAGSSLDKTEKLLDQIYLNGVIRRHRDKGGKQYAALAFVPGMAENLHWIRGTDKKLMDLMYEIMKFNGMISFKDKKVGTARTVPIEAAMPSESASIPYQDATALVKNAAKPIVVFPCGCRMKMKKCDAPLEVCMAFGDHAQFFIDAGNTDGRQITTEEALEVLRISADAGLVHQLINYTDDDISWLCNCCGCCCTSLGFSNKFFPHGRIKNVDPSAYIVSVDPAKCSGCESCVNRCPVRALEMKNDIAVLDIERCIGCGQCVSQCHSDALKLIQRAPDKIPQIPKTWRELVDRSTGVNISRN